MKHKKENKCRKILCRTIGVCILFSFLSFCSGKEKTGLKDYADFSFQDILDGILEGSRKMHGTSAAAVEDVECGLIDCVEGV